MPTLTVQQALEMAAQLHRANRLAEAEHVYRQVLAQDPNDPDALQLLGLIAQHRGHSRAAVELIERAISVNPNVAEYHNNLGIAFRDLGRLDDAVAAYRTALSLKPSSPDTYNNLGNALRDQGDPDAAIEAYRAALATDPGLGEAHYNLGITLGSQGRLDDAIEAYRAALTLCPDAAAFHSALILTHNYHPAHTGQTIYDECRRWNGQHAAALAGSVQPHTNSPNPDRRIRVGYVSTDFRTSACAHFLIPLLSQHDPARVEVVCYADVSAGDALTERFRALSAAFRTTVGLSDEQLAAQVRADQIDLLVDLKVHTMGNRLLTFARKPAPVQATWLGYAGTTGLTTVDYRLSDPHLDPPGEIPCSERTVHLPDSFWCYDPLSEELPTSAVPAAGRGFVNFGSMNDFCKVNDGVLSTWARVLHAVPGSRLTLLAELGSHRQRTLDALRALGIDPKRVRFQARRPRPRYLELFHRIDVLLDTFPYTGVTTTLDSLWMGVPVVTMAGARASARGGVSILTNAGLPELIAHTPEEYVGIATALAGDLPRLTAMRASLRQRLVASPMMDSKRFARNMEAAYRTMWRAWCATRTGRPA